MRMPAAALLGTLRGAPLAASLAELRLGGVALGDEGAARRVLECLPAFPRLEALNLRLRASRAAAPARALREAAQLAAARLAPAEGGAHARVALSFPDAWARPAEPRGPDVALEWVESAAVAVRRSLRLVSLDAVRSCSTSASDVDGDSFASESVSASDAGGSGSEGMSDVSNGESDEVVDGVNAQSDDSATSDDCNSESGDDSDDDSEDDSSGSGDGGGGGGSD
ncbi:MAG: hypothetical protein J3K34DRAFT_419817 [Monoraphidium minutum]|nr:MAG: hypothetical protein J3K34DRAFT_419817 [Monoraphidium minutum]